MQSQYHEVAETAACLLLLDVGEQGTEEQSYETTKAHYWKAVPPTPHTVTHVLGVGSLDSPPMRRSSRSDVHTRSHTKLGSVPSSGLYPATWERKHDTGHVASGIRTCRAQRCTETVTKTGGEEDRRHLTYIALNSSSFLPLFLPPRKPLTMTAGIVNPAAHHACTIAHRSGSCRCYESRPR